MSISEIKMNLLKDRKLKNTSESEQIQTNIFESPEMLQDEVASTAAIYAAARNIGVTTQESITAKRSHEENNARQREELKKELRETRGYIKFTQFLNVVPEHIEYFKKQSAVAKIDRFFDIYEEQNIQKTLLKEFKFETVEVATETINQAIEAKPRNQKQERLLNKLEKLLGVTRNVLEKMKDNLFYNLVQKKESEMLPAYLNIGGVELQTLIKNYEEKPEIAEKLLNLILDKFTNQISIGDELGMMFKAEADFMGNANKDKKEFYKIKQAYENFGPIVQAIRSFNASKIRVDAAGIVESAKNSTKWAAQLSRRYFGWVPGADKIFDKFGSASTVDTIYAYDDYFKNADILNLRNSKTEGSLVEKDQKQNIIKYLYAISTKLVSSVGNKEDLSRIKGLTNMLGGVSVTELQIEMSKLASVNQENVEAEFNSQNFPILSRLFDLFLEQNKLAIGLNTLYFGNDEISFDNENKTKITESASAIYAAKGVFKDKKAAVMSGDARTVTTGFANTIGAGIRFGLSRSLGILEPLKKLPVVGSVFGTANAAINPYAFGTAVDITESTTNYVKELISMGKGMKAIRAYLVQNLSELSRLDKNSQQNLFSGLSRVLLGSEQVALELEARREGKKVYGVSSSEQFVQALMLLIQVSEDEIALERDKSAKFNLEEDLEQAKSNLQIFSGCIQRNTDLEGKKTGINVEKSIKAVSDRVGAYATSAVTMAVQGALINEVTVQAGNAFNAVDNNLMGGKVGELRNNIGLQIGNVVNSISDSNVFTVQNLLGIQGNLSVSEAISMAESGNLTPGKNVLLSDGTIITINGDEKGRVGRSTIETLQQKELQARFNLAKDPGLFNANMAKLAFGKVGSALEMNGSAAAAEIVPATPVQPKEQSNNVDTVIADSEPVPQQPAPLPVNSEPATPTTTATESNQNTNQLEPATPPTKLAQEVPAQSIKPKSLVDDPRFNNNLAQKERDVAEISSSQEKPTKAVDNISNVVQPTTTIEPVIIPQPTTSQPDTPQITLSEVESEIMRLESKGRELQREAAETGTGRFMESLQIGQRLRELEEKRLELQRAEPVQSKPRSPVSPERGSAKLTTPNDITPNTKTGRVFITNENGQKRQVVTAGPESISVPKNLKNGEIVTLPNGETVKVETINGNRVFVDANPVATPVTTPNNQVVNPNQARSTIILTPTEGGLLNPQGQIVGVDIQNILPNTAFIKDGKVVIKDNAGDIVPVTSETKGLSLQERSNAKVLEAKLAQLVEAQQRQAQQSATTERVNIPNRFIPVTFGSTLNIGPVNPLKELAINSTDLVNLPGSSPKSSTLITINGKTESLVFTKNSDGSYKAIVKSGDGKFYTLDTSNPLVKKALEADPKTQKLFTNFDPNKDIPQSKLIRTLDNTVYYDPKLPTNKTEIRQLYNSIQTINGKTLNNFIFNYEVPIILANETALLAKAFGIDTSKLNDFVDGGRNLDSNVENAILRKADSGNLTPQEAEALKRYTLVIKRIKETADSDNPKDGITGSRLASNNSVLYKSSLEGLPADKRIIAAAGQRIMSMFDSEGKFTPNSIRNGEHIGVGASESDLARNVGGYISAVKGLTMAFDEQGNYVNRSAFGSDTWTGLVNKDGIPYAFEGVWGKLDQNQRAFVIEQTTLAKSGEGYFGLTDGTIATIQAEYERNGKTIPTRDQILAASVVAGIPDYLGQATRIQGLSNINGVKNFENFSGYLLADVFPGQRDREQNSSSLLNGLLNRFATKVDGAYADSQNYTSVMPTFNQRPLNDPSAFASAGLSMILSPSPSFMIGADFTNTKAAYAGFGDQKVLDPNSYKVTQDQNGFVTVKYILPDTQSSGTPITGAEMAYIVQGLTGKFGVGVGFSATTTIGGSETPVQVKIAYENTDGVRRSTQNFLKISEEVIRSKEFDRDDSSIGTYQKLLVAKAQELRSKGLISEKDYQIAVTLSTNQEVVQAFFSKKGNLPVGEFGEFAAAQDFIGRRGEVLNMNTLSTIGTTSGFTIGQITSFQGSSQDQTVSNLIKATVTDKLGLEDKDGQIIESAIKQAGRENNSFNPATAKLPEGFSISKKSQQELIDSKVFEVVTKPNGSQYIAYTTVMADGSVETRMVPKDAGLSWHAVQDKNGKVIAMIRNTDTCVGNLDIPVEPSIQRQLEIDSRMNCINNGICEVGQWKDIEAEFAIQEEKARQIKATYAESVKQNGNLFTGPALQLTQAIYVARGSNEAIIAGLNQLVLQYKGGNDESFELAAQKYKESTGIEVTKEFVERYLSSGGVQADRINAAKVDQKYDETFGISFGVGPLFGFGLKFGNEQTVNAIGNGEYTITGLSVNSEGDPCLKLAVTSIGEANFNSKKEVTLAIVLKAPEPAPKQEPTPERTPETPTNEPPKIDAVTNNPSTVPGSQPQPPGTPQLVDNPALGIGNNPGVPGAPAVTPSPAPLPANTPVIPTAASGSPIPVTTPSTTPFSPGPTTIFRAPAATPSPNTFTLPSVRPPGR